MSIDTGSAMGSYRALWRPRMPDKAGGETARERRERHSVKAIAERVEQAHANAEALRQAERLAADAEALADEVQQCEGAECTRQQRRELGRRGAKVEARRLRLMQRDDVWVKQTLEGSRKLSGLMPADAATDGDELLWLIVDRLELLHAFEELKPPSTRVEPKSGKEVRCRTMYEAVVFNLLGVLSRFAGITRGAELRPALLTDERWMALLGFNVAEVTQGSTRRSAGLSGKSREGAGGKFVDAGPLGPARAREEGPRGALSSQSMAGHESRLTAESLTVLFNAVVQSMAKRGYFGERVRTVLDSTGEEVVPSFPGAGVVRKKVKAASKARRPRTVEMQVRGFKVWYLMEVETSIPLAMSMAPIEVAEGVPVKELVQQARKNLGGQSRIVSLAVDRGFLDGDLLWWLEEEERIGWVCPAKEKMEVTEEARERVRHALAAVARGSESALQTARRAAGSCEGHEGVRFFERHVAPGRAPLVVAEVKDLRCTQFYGKGGSSSSRVHSKRFEPKALHATVVLSWPDRSSHRQAEDLGLCPEEERKGPLVVLSARDESALVRYDRYDERSLIENRVNRECKQHFGLGATLARNTVALRSATVFSTIALMLYRALELERERASKDWDARCERLGLVRYRRQCTMQRRGMLMVTIQDRYGLIPLREFAAIAGLEVV